MPVEPQKPYIASKEAAKKFGLTNDHIGLLCRRGKIQGLLWGRMWYVSEPSLVAYAKKNSEEKEVRRRELSKQWRAAWTAALLGMLFCGGAHHASADYVSVRLEPLHQPGTVARFAEDVSELVSQPVEVPAPRTMQAATIQAGGVPEKMAFEIPTILPMLYAGVLELGDITAAVLEAEPASVHVTYLTPPQQETHTLLAALVETNVLLGDMNEAMYGLYLQSLSNVFAALRFDAQQFAYVWGETFGAFGEYYVRDLSKLNDTQVALYFAAAEKIELAYNAFADEADAAVTLDSSISVASVSLSPGVIPITDTISGAVGELGSFALGLVEKVLPITAVEPDCNP